MKKSVVCLCLGVSFFSFAQQPTDSLNMQHLDEIVVTDSKFKLKRENSGKVITKITQAELSRLQGKSIAEIINNAAGVEINGTKSNAGQNLSYFVRGGRNRQVLILIDGIAVTDASQIANDYDLRLLNANQVESIEILKGASSTLYGSGAATAVINIKLKSAGGKPVSANLSSVMGSNQSHKDKNYALNDFRNNVNINGTINKFNYLASFGNQYSDGLSAIENGNESDPFNSINANLKLGFIASESFKVYLSGNFDKFKAHFDDGFLFSDANNRSRTDQYRVGISSELSYNNGSLTLNGAYNSLEREVASSYPTIFKSNSFIGDVYNRYNFNSKFYTVLGLNFKKSDMESFAIPFGENELELSIDSDTASFDIIDPYFNTVYVSDFGLNLNAGVRLNNHSEYGSHLVYSFNPSFKKDLKFGYFKGMASYSTAYITPSLFQLFEPLYGNTDLKPEENTTIEIGLELKVKGKALLNLVYFNRKETNFVDFVDLGSFVFQYDNVDEDFTAHGLEFGINYNVSEKLQFIANATYTRVEEHLNLRIPEIKANAKLNYQILDGTFLSVSYQYNDERADAYFDNTSFTNTEVTLEPYSLLDFYISQKLLKERMRLFANMTNIFNTDYNELFGYTTRGRNISLGFNLTL